MDAIPKDAVKCGKCSRIIGLAIAKATQCCPYCGEDIAKEEVVRDAETSRDAR